MEQEKTHVECVRSTWKIPVLEDALGCLKELIAAKQELQGQGGAQVML